MASKHTIQDLQYLQAMPLNLKISITKNRIREWIRQYGSDGVYVSFSGGKDSTVLLNLVREEYPSVSGVFCDTGLEFPEIRNFVKTFENVEWLKPKLTFRQVIEKYGYPIIRIDMNRQQRRKAGIKAKEQTYTVKRSQLNGFVREDIEAEIQNAYQKGINDGFALMLTIPLEVLIDYYWEKSFQRRIPEFVEHCIEYYERFLSGELDMEKMREDLWRYGGVRLEEADG